MTQSLNVAACATLVLGEALRLRGMATAEEVSIQASARVRVRARVRWRGPADTRAGGGGGGKYSRYTLEPDSQRY